MSTSSDYYDSDSSSTDEEFMEFAIWSRRPYTLRERVNHFKWDDADFISRFRLDKDTVRFVLSLIEGDIKKEKKNSIKPMEKLMLTLRFYALGSMLLAVGDFAGVSKSSACIIVREVSVAIAKLSPIFIKMPSNENEIREEKLKFFKKAKLSRIIGAIDCTHVKIQSPGGIYAENFRNRKGYFSINVQTVSSADLKIMDIVARWPGSCHDQTIYNNSRIKNRLHSGEFGNSLIVGDCGYANSRYTITPLVQTHNRAQELYNEAVIRTRNPVERKYGVWKRRFPVIAYGIRLKLDTTQAVIIATAVLHNIAVQNKLPSPVFDPDLELRFEEINWREEAIEEDEVINARDFIIQNFNSYLS